MSRCRNCGELEHLTQHCDVFGPWFPEPGKTGQDYGVEAERIGQLVAQDVFNEHLAMHAGEEEHEVAPEGSLG